jgi:hypothetical protein
VVVTTMSGVSPIPMPILYYQEDEEDEEIVH